MPTQGYLSLVLHSHLPYVVHHGVWPHGLDWLHEATAETYLPVLRLLQELEQEGLAARFSINLSPILLEQLSHPTFRQEFPGYVNQKVEAAQKDAAEFERGNERHYLEVARFWENYYGGITRLFEEIGGDLVGAFRHFYESGQIDILTCAATHGYFPLLGTDASIHAQVGLAVRTHERYFGRRPRGIWLPECGYRPAGPWSFPVAANGLGPHMRAGVEEILARHGLEFFVVDTHLLEDRMSFTPYEVVAGDVERTIETEPHPVANIYRPYYVAGANNAGKVAFFTRDPRTGIQVWSGERGYPGEAHYLDFHKKRWPSGHRYWQVTHPKVDLGGKTPYFPERARERARDHARHFAGLVTSILADDWARTGGPGVLAAPFDAELFGHWWFEGPQFLRHVVEELSRPGGSVELATCAEYLDRYPPQAWVGIPEGSWGRGGGHEVWLNPDTEWTWRRIYPAERTVERLVRQAEGDGDPARRRILQQLCRELLLMEASDWQFLISARHAGDYAQLRFETHARLFGEVLDIWDHYAATGTLEGETGRRLDEIEQRDSVFPDLDPALYLAG